MPQNSQRNWLRASPTPGIGSPLFSFHMDGHKENNAQICRFHITNDVKHLYLTPPRFLESLWAEVNTGKALI